MPEPMYRSGVPSPEDFYFIINDGNRAYDIEEMSAGEQAVFPILYEFVRQRIRNSIVLIDEVDLNLHPPLAQAFLAALPVIGPNCQFLLTTHSEAVTSVVSPEQIYRLPGGRLCL
jgi:predicted ATP-dependent endonuclease of OLD family